MQNKEEIVETLKQNNDFYLKIVDIAKGFFSRNDYEKALEYIEIAGTAAVRGHPGLFADGRIENLALEIGEKLDTLVTKDISIPESFSKKSIKKKVLHLATTVSPIGGHTRLVKNWIKSFDDFEHSLLVSNQGKYPIPKFLTEVVNKSGGIVSSVPHSNSLLEKSWFVRQITKCNFDYVILHHHMNDVVPVVALADKECPPVAVVNHADHLFWLGISIADLVVDFCRLGSVLSLERRTARKSVIVPLLIDIPQPSLSRREARQRLNINDDETVLITIGSAYKYTPTAKYNFFITAKKILEANKSARIYFVGVDESQTVEKNNRMIFLGIVNDTMPYQIAADIYLDGFPVGGGMAAVESALLDLYPIFAYDQILDSTARKLIEFEEMVTAEASENKYIERMTELIENPGLRVAESNKIKNHILNLHSRERIFEYKKSVFEYMDSITHQFAPIPEGDLMTENADISLAMLNPTRRYDHPLLLERIWGKNIKSTRKEFIRSLLLSIRLQETKLSKHHFRAWIGTAKDVFSI